MTTGCGRRVIAGLGNPGFEYSNTRHNLGFIILDELISKHSLSLVDVGKSCVGRYENAILCKPNTFMNLSGQALRTIKDFYKISNDDFLVVYDDIHMPIGSFKYSVHKSHGGHNGIRNIISELGSNTFLKLRIGIGSKPGNVIMSDYVLGKFSETEMNSIKNLFPKIIKSLEEFASGATPEFLQNNYN